MSLVGPAFLAILAAFSSQAAPPDSTLDPGPYQAFFPNYCADCHLEGVGARPRRGAGLQELRDARSILDAVSSQANDLKRELGAVDREKMDDYLAAIRETEERLLRAEAWEGKPKPKAEMPAPKDPADGKDILDHEKLMYALMHLALVTDSTRVLTFFQNGMNAVPKIPGVTQDYHNLSHHGKDPAKIAELGVVERSQIACIGEFLGKLKASPEDGGTLLDQTIVLAGGGFKHGQHLALGGERDYPLSNLYLSMLQRLGVETSTFGTGTGTMRGLEFV